MSNKVETFENLDVWQAAMDLAVDFYGISKSWTDFNTRNQMQRAALSISSNIAEGFERQTNKEFSQFLYIAKGSCGELRSQMIFAERVGLLNSGQYQNLKPRALATSKQLAGLIRYRKDNPKP